MRKILVIKSKALDDEEQGCLISTMLDLSVVDVDPTLSHTDSVVVDCVFRRQVLKEQTPPVFTLHHVLSKSLSLVLSSMDAISVLPSLPTAMFTFRRDSIS